MAPRPRKTRRRGQGCLQRVDPAKRFAPDAESLKAYVGSYALPSRAPFTFSIKEGNLLAHRQGQTFSGVALDETRFAFEDLGLVTFYPVPNGTVPTLEWWTRLFTRTEEP